MFEPLKNQLERQNSNKFKSFDVFDFTYFVPRSEVFLLHN